MPDRKQPAEVHAAGAVLWRPAAAGPEVALIHRPRYDDWSFPKGKRMPGEHVLLAAVREVQEETGVGIALGWRLHPARYRTEDKPKRVDYWVARTKPDGCDPADPPATFVPNAEVDDLAWLPLTAARDRLSYEYDARVLDEFASGPATTSALILVRHTSARGKKAWYDAGQPDDLTRPLTPRGQAQAEHLAELLSCFGPARVISSAAQRCVATVEPYATLAGTKVETETALALAPAEPDGWAAATRQRIAAAWQRARAQRLIGDLATAGRPAVICAHRENLPALLEWACERLGTPVPHGPPLAKGSFWVLHVSAGRLVSAEQHHLGS